MKNHLTKRVCPYGAPGSKCGTWCPLCNYIPVKEEGSVGVTSFPGYFEIMCGCCIVKLIDSNPTTKEE